MVHARAQVAVALGNPVDAVAPQKIGQQRMVRGWFAPQFDCPDRRTNSRGERALDKQTLQFSGAGGAQERNQARFGRPRGGGAREHDDAGFTHDAFQSRN